MANHRSVRLDVGALLAAVERETTAEETRMFAPVTNRGEAIGVLELRLDEPPDEEMVADVGLRTRAP